MSKHSKWVCVCVCLCRSLCMCVCVCFCRVYLTRWIAICICLYNQFGCFNEPIIWWAEGIIKKSHPHLLFLPYLIYTLIFIPFHPRPILIFISVNFFFYSSLTLITIFFFFTQSVFYFFYLSVSYSRLYPSAISIFIVMLIRTLAYPNIIKGECEGSK